MYSPSYSNPKPADDNRRIRIVLFHVSVEYLDSYSSYEPLNVMLGNDRMERSFGVWFNTEMGEWAHKKGLEFKLYGYTDANTYTMKIHVYADVDYETHLEYKELVNLAIITGDKPIPEYFVP
jgi:hypothetical protein